MQSAFDPSIYVITDDRLSYGRSHREVVEKAIEGGATCVQLREKDATSRDFFKSALELRKLTWGKGVALIINDRLDIALAVDADGVHLGQDDLPLDAARRLMPPEMILGASAGNILEALKAQSLGVSYLGVGTIFRTGTKADAGEPIGLQVLADICSNLTIPVVGIGGINTANAGLVIKAGAAGVAVISSIVAAPDITAVARELAGIVKHSQSLESKKNDGGSES